MSSSIGHTLIALSIQRATEPTEFKAKVIPYFNWTLCLVGVANLPDIGRLLQFLGSPYAEMTHSVIFVLFCPLGLLPLVYYWMRGPERSVAVGQLFIVLLSHLAADLLVGVRSYPLFWPFIDHPVQLSFGLLPSSPGVSWTNLYLYRNLALEMAIFLPLYHLSGWKKFRLWPRNQVWLTSITLLSLIVGLYLSFYLDRP